MEYEIEGAEPDVLTMKTEFSGMGMGTAMSMSENSHIKGAYSKSRKVYSPVFKYVLNGEEHKTVDYRTYAHKLFEHGDRVDILLSEKDNSKCRVKGI